MIPKSHNLRPEVSLFLSFFLSFFLSLSFPSIDFFRPAYPKPRGRVIHPLHYSCHCLCFARKERYLFLRPFSSLPSPCVLVAVCEKRHASVFVSFLFLKLLYSLRFSSIAALRSPYIRSPPLSIIDFPLASVPFQVTLAMRPYPLRSSGDRGWAQGIDQCATIHPSISQHQSPFS